jgi:hypothetical protein
MIATIKVGFPNPFSQPQSRHKQPPKIRNVVRASNAQRFPMDTAHYTTASLVVSDFGMVSMHHEVALARSVGNGRLLAQAYNP